jgi:hypothetical protein
MFSIYIFEFINFLTREDIVTYKTPIFIWNGVLALFIVPTSNLESKIIIKIYNSLAGKKEKRNV